MMEKSGIVWIALRVLLLPLVFFSSFFRFFSLSLSLPHLVRLSHWISHMKGMRNDEHQIGEKNYVCSVHKTQIARCE